MFSILIIEDEDKIRTLMSRIIALEGFRVEEAADCKSGLKKFETLHPEVVISDVKLPDGSGLDLLKTLKSRSSYSEIILLTAYGNIQDSVEAIKNGAFDYLTKGDDNNRILPLIYKAIEKVKLSKRVLQLEKQVQKRYSFDSILGNSEPLKRAKDIATKVATTNSTVLLLGETGTGKEVFAQAIHHSGIRNTNSFVAINCSAFSKDLLESELFGYKAGAFTGALKDKKGLLEEANKGTLFLDEIGEMPIELQAKLLRLLENGEYYKIGETQISKADVRIIAATNKNLQEEIKKGNFRQDLYYRLAVLIITLPSLKERKNDIPILANYYATSSALKMNQNVPVLSKEYISALQEYSWPGNIRELKNIVERSIILSDSEILSKESLPQEFQHESDSVESPLSEFSLAYAEKLHIKHVFQHTGGNKTETAKLLNIALTTLYRKLEEYGIS